VSPE
jgi:hypothetical protein